MTAAAINTPQTLIVDAYQDAGILKRGGQPDSDMYAHGLRRLRYLINFAQTQGLRLWLNVDVPVPLVALQNNYTFAPGGDVNMTKPLRALQGYMLNAQGQTVRSIWPISWNEWLLLSNRGTTSPGTISQYFVDKLQTELSVYFWSTPSATEAANTAHLLLQTQVDNPTNLTETVNFPLEWGQWLHWGLASELATGQPQEVISRCDAKAAEAFEALNNWDVEDAETMFTPDIRMQYPNSRFR